MIDTETLYNLLPAIYRIRDAENGEPLRALVEALAEQAAVLDESLAQLYDDQFIETCADWVIPYIGDLIGYRGLYGLQGTVSSPRAEVANTIAYRRRKGTAAMLEQLARDVTDWDARVVEFFRLLATTQYMNHVRPTHLATPDLRRWEPLEWINTPFEQIAHTADVRHINQRRGKFNIPNIGIFLWRIQDYSLTRSPAVAVPDDPSRYYFSPLGASLPLYTRPQAEPTITHLAEPINVPLPISRRLARERLDLYYGRDKSVLIELAGVDAAGKLDPRQPVRAIDAADVAICNLSDVTDAAGHVVWAHTPPDKVAIDPVLGRLAFPSGGPYPPDRPAVVLVTFHYGFSMAMGGGEYERAASFSPVAGPLAPVQMPANIQPAVASLNGQGVIEIRDSGRYAERLVIAARPAAHIELRAANGARPTIVTDQPEPLIEISGGDEAEVSLNGLLMIGSVRVTGALRRVRLTHCTLVPGSALTANGLPASPDQPGLVVNAPNCRVEIDHSIVGGLRVGPDSEVSITNSIIDATAETRPVYVGLDGASAGGPLTVVNSTLIGRVWTVALPLASNTVFLAAPDPADAPGLPVWVDRRQEGCVRFSYVPPGSRTPRRYQCQPADAAQAGRLRPTFTALRYGRPGYGQLDLRTPREIRAGADDESEMGAFHDLYALRRETNLRVRLDEYLRFGLEAGIFYAS